MSLVTKLGQTRDLGTNLFSYAVVVPLITCTEELFGLGGGEKWLFGGFLVLFKEAMNTRGNICSTEDYRGLERTHRYKALYCHLFDFTED